MNLPNSKCRRPKSALRYAGLLLLLLLLVIIASLFLSADGQTSEKEKLRARLAAFLKKRNKANDHGEDHRDEFKVRRVIDSRLGRSGTMGRMRITGMNSRLGLRRVRDTA